TLPMATTTIRPATADDAESIAEIHVRAWRETYAGLLPKALLDGLSVERRVAWWRGLLDGTNNPSRTAVFIAVGENDQAVGFGSCGRQRDPELDAAGFDAEVETIYLLDKVKRLGTGRQLMTTLAAAMLTEGYRGAALWVLRENDSARRFYEALGAAIVGEREEWRSDDFVMREVAYGWPDLDVLQSLARPNA
ncbi:MAG: GNAT family N-acetyltransferase, partial [Geminicoccaceae bacterium]